MIEKVQNNAGVSFKALKVHADEETAPALLRLARENPQALQDTFERINKETGKINVLLNGRVDCDCDDTVYLFIQHLPSRKSMPNKFSKLEKINLISDKQSPKKIVAESLQTFADDVIKASQSVKSTGNKAQKVVNELMEKYKYN